MRLTVCPSGNTRSFSATSQGFLTLKLRAGISSLNLDSYTYYYCFPPPSFILPTLLHFLKHQSRGLLLVPVWPASSYWSLIVPDGVHLAQWGRSLLKFKPSGFEVSPAVTSGTFRSGWFEMLGIEFDFLGLQELGGSKVQRRTCLAGGCCVCV